MCMTKHSGIPDTSTYSSTRHNTNKNTTSISPPTQTYNILQHSKAKKHHFQQQPLHNKHSHRPPHNHYNRHKTNMRHIHTYIVSMYLATRGNNKILRTPPPHISSSKEIPLPITCRTLSQLRTNKYSFLKS